MTLRGGIIKRSPIYKVISIFIIVCFVLSTITPVSFAQQSILIQPLSALGVGVGSVPIIKGLKLYPENPLKFDFIIDSGKSKASGEVFKIESTKLIKYFLASLTTKENDLWVNLNPKQPDKIIPNSFGSTEMGRDLLAQDYILKQITASLMHPEGEVGKKFWEKIYKQAFDKYGTTNIDTDVLNRVWIVPERAVVYEAEDRAFVVESRLKVLLEEEYLDPRSSILDTSKKQNKISSIQHLELSIIKSVIIPELERQVNQGQAFAPLRQIYNSLILATWYKRNLKESLLGRKYVDQNKTPGVEIKDKQEKLKIYDQYLKTFKDGAYNYIKEEYDPATKSLIPKKYFCGGKDFATISKILETTGRAQDVNLDNAMLVETNFAIENKISVASDYAMVTQDSLSGGVVDIDERFNPAAFPISGTGGAVKHLINIMNILVEQKIEAQSGFDRYGIPIIANSGGESFVGTFITPNLLSKYKDGIWVHTHPIRRGYITISLNSADIRKAKELGVKKGIIILGDKNFGFFALEFYPSKFDDDYSDIKGNSNFKELYEKEAFKFWGMLDENFRPMAGQISSSNGLNFVQLTFEELMLVLQKLNNYLMFFEDIGLLKKEIEGLEEEILDNPNGQNLYVKNNKLKRRKDELKKSMESRGVTIFSNINLAEDSAMMGDNVSLSNFLNQELISVAQKSIPTPKDLKEKDFDINLWEKLHATVDELNKKEGVFAVAFLDNDFEGKSRDSDVHIKPEDNNYVEHRDISVELERNKSFEGKFSREEKNFVAFALENTFQHVERGIGIVVVERKKNYSKIHIMDNGEKWTMSPSEAIWTSKGTGDNTKNKRGLSMMVGWTPLTIIDSPGELIVTQGRKSKKGDISDEDIVLAGKTSGNFRDVGTKTTGYFYKGSYAEDDAKDAKLQYVSQKLKDRIDFNDIHADIDGSIKVIDEIFESSVDVDNAMVTKEVGGIDLNAEKLKIESKGAEIDFDSFYNLEEFENIEINGLTPVILNIMPIAPAQIPMLLGIAEDENFPEEYGSQKETHGKSADLKEEYPVYLRG
ncbi:MAG: hypothetical protein P9X22_07700 [Candidatus Zapsychrus exili]|nr:hypothetical protein [Candidatus Zapsychrus exili]